MISSTAPQLLGRSLIAGTSAKDGGETFHGFNPQDGSQLEPAFFSATAENISSAVAAAVAAFPSFSVTSNVARGQLLRTMADGLDAATTALVEQAHLETALPRPRLTGEVARTTGQLRFFAAVVEEGSWVMARIDMADPSRTPPKPDIRSMLRALGPVVVFGASNLPLAFSVAGGDTASALAAGNPVIVKAHPAHPGTSELVASILTAAVEASGLHRGVFSLLFDAGHTVGTALVQHPAVQAVGFTGSHRAGRTLMDLAAKRHNPIPIYAEMGSTNPVFILPEALASRGEEIATGLHGSFTLGAGQFCTKPGMVFAKAERAKSFTERMRSLTQAGPAFSLLTKGIAATYEKCMSERESLLTATSVATSDGFSAKPMLVETNFDHFSSNPDLAEEVFGPTTLLVHYEKADDLLKAAHALEGHLTATVHGTENDLRENAELIQVLETKAGRVIINGFPTGVEVCHAMVHGGPYPSTSDGRSTSVGSQAIFRFARPVAYQGFPQALLPEALQDHNPLKLLRLKNGQWDGPAL